MSAAQRDATTALLRTALNERGLDKVRALMALEITLRELEAFGCRAIPRTTRSRCTASPAPAAGAGASKAITCRCTSASTATRYVATLPQFFGANPAVVPRDVAGGAARGLPRCSAPRRTCARQWLAR